MGQKTLTIYEVPEDVRQKGANSARERITQALASPMSSEYRETLISQLKWVNRVSALDVADVVSPPTEPTKHEVNLGEVLESREAVR
jgi:hypothetical protein